MRLSTYYSGMPVAVKKLFALIILIFSMFSARSQVIISEIDYDNIGTDYNEKIELFGINGTDLTGWKLILYNGANGAAYNTLGLSGAIPFNCTGADGVSYGVKVISYTGPDAIQNGSPDGVALVNAFGTVVEFLSYEGTFTATDGPANGMVSTDIAPGLFDSNTQEGSLERHANNAWAFITTNSFGVCNPGLILGSICSLSVPPVNGFFSLANPATICSGSQTSLSLDIHTTTVDATFQWLYKNSTTGNVFVNLGAVQNSPTKITTVTEATDYYCIVYCNGTNFTTSNPVTVNMYSIPPVTPVFVVDCNTHTTQLSLTGLQAGVTYTYQWQKNVNSGGWNNIPSATNSTLSQPTTAYTTAYRCNITACSGATSTTSLEVTPDNGNCYCLPLYTDACGSSYLGPDNLSIRNVELNTLANFNDIQRICDATLYENFLPEGTNTTNLQQGHLYNLHLNLQSASALPVNGGSSLAAWIDYNDNYIFEPTERITDLRNLLVSPDGLIVDIPLSVATNAPLGLHRMRIREANQTQGLPVPPCDVSMGQFIDGETEDYSISIVAAAACTGGSSVGGTVSANQTVCISATPNPVTLSGNTGSIIFWQQSNNAAFTNPTNILNTTSTLNIGQVNSSAYYRAVVQNNDCAPAYSASVLITVTNITAVTLLATSGQTGGQSPAPSGSTYYMNNCKLIASSVPYGSTSPAASQVSVTIDGAVQHYNSIPYLQRHYDYSTGSPSISSGLQLTIYCLQSEFSAFNAARGSYKSLPVAGTNADINIANIRVVKYEGSNPGGAPGSYPPGTITNVLTPGAINWNAAHTWWEITIFAGGGINWADGTGGYFIQSVFDCQPPAVSVSNVSSTGATAFWNTLPGAAGYEYAVQTVNTAPAGAGTATNNTPVNLNGLTENTNYYFFVRTICAEDGFSSWASTHFFTAITTTAKIGIGTQTPSSNLEIASDGIPDIRISSTHSFGPARLSLLSDKGTANEWRPGYIESGNNGDYTGRLDFYTNGSGASNKLGAVKAMSISNASLIVTGTVTANGTLLNSDARYKTRIGTLPHPLNNLVKLRGTEYYFNCNAFPSMNFSSDRQIGLLAQEVEKIYPELVSTNQDGYKSVNYTGLIPVLIESIKEQQKQIEKQKQQLENLTKLVNKLLNK